MSLLSEADLTLENAIRIAQSMESAGAEVRKLKDPAASVFRMKFAGSGSSVNGKSHQETSLLSLWSQPSWSPL